MKSSCNNPSLLLGTVKHFKIAAVLDMSLYEFAHHAQDVDNMIANLVNESGLTLNSTRFSEYNSEQ